MGIGIRQKSKRRSKPLAQKMAQEVIDRQCNVRAVPLFRKQRPAGTAPRRYGLRNGRLVSLPD